MGKEETQLSDQAQYRAKSLLKSLGELTPDILEDISIGAEKELASRDIEQGVS